MGLIPINKFRGDGMDTKILLENGTNELEVLEFRLDGNSYGINVAKIREIITYQDVTLKLLIHSSHFLKEFLYPYRHL